MLFPLFSQKKECVLCSNDINLYKMRPQKGWGELTRSSNPTLNVLTCWFPLCLIHVHVACVARVWEASRNAWRTELNGNVPQAKHLTFLSQINVK